MKSRKKATGNILASIRSSNMGGSMLDVTLDGSLACLNAFFFGLKAGIHTRILVAE